MTLLGPARLVSRLWMSIEFKPQDLWVGAFWKKNTTVGGDMGHDAWVCVVPMFPLHFRWKIRPRGMTYEEYEKMMKPLLEDE